MSETEILLDTEQVARMIGSTPQFLEKLRADGNGPVFLKLGRLVRFRRSDVEKWLSDCAVRSTTQARNLRRGRAS